MQIVEISISIILEVLNLVTIYILLNIPAFFEAGLIDYINYTMYYA